MPLKSNVISTVRVSAWLFLAAILLLTFVPPAFRPVSLLPRAAEHFAIFFAMGAAFALGYEIRAWRLGGMAIIFAGALEVLQIVTPGRHARVSDFVVDALGACLGIAAAMLYRRATRPSGVER